MRSWLLLLALVLGIGIVLVGCQEDPCETMQKLCSEGHKEVSGKCLGFRMGLAFTGPDKRRCAGAVKELEEALGR